MRPSPGALTRLIGRDAELAHLPASLRSTRLLTLTGPGGVGKTRLAQELATDWTTPVHVCELDACSEPGQVPAAVANAFGFPTLEATIIGHTGRESLLVLDNCEHLLDSVADAAEELLRRCPGLRILATSRERLAIPGELLVTVSPLATSSGGSAEPSAAALLFLDRAEALASTWQDHRQDIERLCAEVDGLPLAIKLAAARTPAVPLPEMREALGRLGAPSQSDAGAAGAPRPDGKRDRGAVTAIEWSVERLSPELCRRFTRLGVFEQAFSLEAAHVITRDAGDELPATIAALQELVGFSLLDVQQDDQRTWYRMLSVVRDVARGQLRERGEHRAITDRWIDLMVEYAEELAEQARHTWTKDLTRSAELLHDDLADALSSAVRVDATGTRVYPLVTALWGSVAQGHSEGTGRLGMEALQRFPDRSVARSDAAAVTAWAGLVNADPLTALWAAGQALDGPASPFAAVLAHLVRHQVARCSGDPDGSVRELRAALDVAGVAGLRPWRTDLSLRWAGARAALGDSEGARRTLAEATADAADMPLSVAARAATLLTVLDHLDNAPAETSFDSAVALARRTGEPSAVGETLRVAGAVAVLHGDVPAAAATLREALDALLSAGRNDLLPTTMRWIAGMLVVARQHVTAAMVLGGVGMNGADTLDPLELALAELLGSVQPAPGMTLLASLELARRSADEHSVTLSPDQPDDPRTEIAALLREGSVWRLRYGEIEIVLATSRGLADLAELLRHPGQEIASADLVGGGVQDDDLGPAFQERTARECQRRIADLQSQRDDANALGRSADAARMRLEIAELRDQMRSATGPVNRRRRSGSSAERAQSAVSWRIRAAVERIAHAHPALGEHLRSSVHTGAMCRYQPVTPVVWRVEGDAAAQGRSGFRLSG